MEITTILWREWLFLKRRFWRVTFSQMVSPLLYFVTFGMGLGRVMEMDGRPYLYYLIPGLLAMTTMRNSYTSVSTRISVMRLSVICIHPPGCICWQWAISLREPSAACIPECSSYCWELCRGPGWP